MWISAARRALALLAGYWLAWALYPVPGAAFSYLSLLHPSSWLHAADGFGLHWSKANNLGAAFDLWFLNLFPRQTLFTGNAGGYVTLNFLPTIGTMILGIFAGRWFRDLDERRATLRAARQALPPLPWPCCCMAPASAPPSSASGRRVGRC